MVSQLTSPLPEVPGTKMTPRTDVPPDKPHFVYEEYFRDGRPFDEVWNYRSSGFDGCRNRLFKIFKFSRINNNNVFYNSR